MPVSATGYAQDDHAADRAAAGPQHWDGDREACRAVMRLGSRTFSLAAQLLPPRLRLPATAVYAFCRMADDAVDSGDRDPVVAVAELLRRLDGIYAGRPHPDLADRAFACVVREFALPRALPEALIEGFAWDAAGRRYADFDALTGYAARVAGTVGAMMSVLMERRSAAVIARACDLGVAMQLTNIARDVGEDARVGRLYLPLDWLAAEGIDPDRFLAAPAPSPALGRVVARLLAAADRLYERSGAGIAALPRDCRPAILAARHFYAEIGREVERRGLDSVSTRAVVPGRRLLKLLPRVIAGLAGGTAGLDAESPLPATQFLVDAVAASARPGKAAPPPWWDLAGNAAQAIALFERLEARERGLVEPHASAMEAR